MEGEEMEGEENDGEGSTPLKRTDDREDLRYGESDRALEYRRLMKILATEYEGLDWMMRDTIVNVHLDDPDLTADQIANETPRDYKFYTPYKETGEKRPRGEEEEEREGKKEQERCPPSASKAKNCEDGPSTSIRPMEVV
jgi:hypothetical protein